MTDKRTEIELGCSVKDVITGLKGVAIGRLEYIHGAVEYGVQLQSIDSDRMGSITWIPWQRLDVVNAEPIQLPGIVREVTEATKE